MQSNIKIERKVLFVFNIELVDVILSQFKFSYY